MYLLLHYLLLLAMITGSLYYLLERDLHVLMIAMRNE
jgi:hypothetical protein